MSGNHYVETIRKLYRYHSFHGHNYVDNWQNFCIAAFLQHQNNVLQKNPLHHLVILHCNGLFFVENAMHFFSNNYPLAVMIRIYKMRFMANQKKKLEEKKILTSFRDGCCCCSRFCCRAPFLLSIIIVIDFNLIKIRFSK